MVYVCVYLVVFTVFGLFTCWLVYLFVYCVQLHVWLFVVCLLRLRLCLLDVSCCLVGVC